jgi:serine/threonine protein kinase
MTQTFTTFQEFKKRYPIQFAEKGTWLGSGTYGKVFRVEDQVETEWVAVKISEYRQNDTKSLKAEVELTQKVPRHANIARYDACYRLETDTGISDFAVMKYYSDGNLADLLKRSKLTDKELRDIVRGTLEGLKHLHQQRIVHRDFKPANILISRDNSGRFIPKIADFGLSKLVSQDEIDSSDFDLSDGRGTPSYKAPEQIEGGRVSFNLDLWAFGVILYEMLTGEKPFSVGTQSSEPTLRREIERKITSAQLPDRLRTLAEPYQSMIQRCLVKDIRQRVRKADELLALLDEPITSKPLSTPPKPVEKPSVVPTEQTDVYVKPKPVLQETQTDVYAPKVVVQKPEIQPKSNNTWLWGLLGGAAVVLLGIWFWPKGITEQKDTQTDTEKVKIAEEPKPHEPIKTTLSPPKNKVEKHKKELKEVDKELIAQQKREEEARQKQEQLEEDNRTQAALKKQQVQQEYDDLIEKGMAAINTSNNKGAAITNFNQASQLANTNGVATAKGSGAYAIYLAKGDRIFANDDYEGAKAWYRVAQALRNTEEVRRKIKECDNNL